MSVPLPRLDEKQRDRLDAWLRNVLWDEEVPCPASDYGTIDVHRLKGRVVGGDGKTFLIQGVRKVFEIFQDRAENDRAAPTSVGGKLVLIGRGLRDAELRDSVEWFVLGRE